ncbi:MAG: NAD(P)-binding protein, partial [Myxococcota bacterium]
MPVQKTKYLVIGAGISGLSFAERLKDTDYLICEADAEPGGYCKTITQGGFVWDYSGHFFHFRDPEIEKYLVSRMGPGEVLKIKKESRIYYANGFIDFPFQKNIHQLPKNEFIDCLVDLYFKESRSDTDSSFESMLYEKFGQSIAEKFL